MIQGGAGQRKSGAARRKNLFSDRSPASIRVLDHSISPVAVIRGMALSLAERLSRRVRRVRS